MPGKSTALTDDDPLFKADAADPEFDPASVARPRTRADCLPGGCNGERPCPWVSCRQNLLLDVHPQTGRISLLRPLADIEAMKYTCALDVADLGGVTLEEAGGMLSITRERIRQIEEHGLQCLRRGLRRRRMEQFADEGRTVVHPSRPAATATSAEPAAEKFCPRCEKTPPRTGQSYCAKCAAEYEHERYLRNKAAQAAAPELDSADDNDQVPAIEPDDLAVDVESVRNLAPERQ